MTQITKARMLVGAALLVAALNAFAWPQSPKPTKAKTAQAKKPAAKQVTLTLVRWPYT